MSTNSSCEFIEIQDSGHWYYILEGRDAPKNAWDWRDYATAYGPFASEQDASRHLSANHCNPGWRETDTLPTLGAADEILAALLADAPGNTSTARRGIAGALGRIN